MHGPTPAASKGEVKMYGMRTTKRKAAYEAQLNEGPYRLMASLRV